MKQFLVFVLCMFTLVAFQNPLAAQEKSKTPLKEAKMEKDPQDFKAPKPSKVAKNEKGKPVPGSYIVLLQENVIPSFKESNEKSKRKFKNRKEQEAAANKFEAEAKKKVLKYAKEKFGLNPSQITNIYTGIQSGFAVKLDPNSSQKSSFLSKAKSSKEIAQVDQNSTVKISATSVDVASAAENANFSMVQYPSWGTYYVGSCNYTGIYWAWILDTGIDLNHPDLNVITSSSYAKSFVNSEASPDDYNGHGTHVAGIVAAKNNTIGTKGVAAGARVVPVKVLNRYGSGTWADLIQGLQHVYYKAWAKDVVNLSLSGGVYPLADAWVRAIGNRGVFVTMAAGNSSAHANNYSPSRANGPRVYTISAMDVYGNLAWFSNHGNPPIDFAAPGDNIRSTYKNGLYATMDGTSMAAPHVAGICLCNQGAIYNRGRLYWDRDATKDLKARK